MNVCGRREEQIRELFPLVRFLAKRLVRTMPAVDLGDLIGDGCIGLIRAVDAYDPSRGIPLRYYARKMIVGAMLNGLRKMDPVSERARRAIRLADAKRHAIAQEQGTLPSLCAMAGSTPGLAAALRCAHIGQPLSLDGHLSREETGLLDRRSDPADIAARKLLSDELREAIALLPERQRNVVELHYYREVPLAAIGAKLNVSPQRASQLHLAALKKIRRRLGVYAG